MQSCPECDGHVETSPASGEEYCTDCGLITDDTCIDRGPDWRAYDAEEQEDRVRAGAPETALMHDKGLSTVISWQDKDAQGQSLTASKRQQMRRLRKWDERSRTENSQDRNLREALGEIQRMGSELDVARAAQETASKVYRRAQEKNLMKGRSLEEMAAAALYAACRIHYIPVILDDLAVVSRVHVPVSSGDQATLTDITTRADSAEVKRDKVKGAYRYLLKELELETPVPEPHRFVPRLANELDLEARTEAVAIEFLKELESEDGHASRQPMGMAAAGIYSANLVRGEPQQIRAQDVADAAGVSAGTVRKRYSEVLEINDYAPDLAAAGNSPNQSQLDMEGDA